LGYNPFVSATGEAGQRPSRLGRYELITRIGQGGMAEVQLALQRGPAGFEKLVVVKLVHENLASQRAFVDMLLDEARVAALVKHPNVVDIYDLGEAEGRYFIAMEYLEGEPLLAVLRAGREGKRLDALSTARLIADTAEGLDAAHELRSMAGQPLELVHHDISLGNIVVLYNGQVKLVDFGVAKASQSASTRTKVQGKFSYMAPEKLQGAPGDRRSDLFSLGCVLWEALTLKRLYKGKDDGETMKQVLEHVVIPPSHVNGDVIPDFDPIVMRTLARDPDDRYATAKELAADLEEVLRKQGYAAKNDLIAKYMQDTFRQHIDARKKLLQEVSSKGGASAELIEAAFNDPHTGAPTPQPNEFSVRFRREAASLPPPKPVRRAPPTMPPPESKLASSSGLLAVGTDSERSAQGFDGETVIDDRGPIIDDPIVEPPSSVGEPAPSAAPKRTLVYAMGGAVALALVIVVIALARRGGGDDTTDEPALAKAPAIVPSTADQVQQPSPPPPPPAEPTREIEMEPVKAPAAVKKDPPKKDPPKKDPPKLVKETPRKDPPKELPKKDPPKEPAKKDPPKDPPKVVDKPDPAILLQAGVQAYVRGDTRSALDSFQKLKASSPGFPPVWRGLGMVYEKMGDVKSARASFQRYLQLAPGASDAGTIRSRMEALPL
jgi:serine/threonine-protein kinase